ncbi:hypothetical protein PF010_g14756 [Phytophthora fragariae]|uniref:Uncharacterized protein n=1 Tax=Phytophthora fragariae TaxID=53985 RepID=A0A6A3TG26_9STRA|nr:hypothetical protein PF003_g1204 [Phytophthora fragariae]KAE9100624.1 hypothetical protein PF010_g14756 [Phytophthora fragariae]KAE9136559.1 hypothetical protein PF006_g14361 [Phytophthora fragariae]KAE9214898.1 hypothetical protein PF004_g14915 [Phytophthora fragariae]
MKAMVEMMAVGLKAMVVQRSVAGTNASCVSF